MKKSLNIIVLLGLCFSILSCEKDNPKQLNANSPLVKAANAMFTEHTDTKNHWLGDTIILSTEAKMSGVSKTLLPTGCPTKFFFKWQEEQQRLYVRLPKFTVGTMPFSVVFYCDATYSELNTWEKDEYPEDGWIKFSANNGVVVPYVPKGVEKPEAEGAAILTGYMNPKTQEIAFTVNYNMMNVVSVCFRQKIDRTRLARYEEEFKKFEKDLEEYKKEHNL